VPFRRGHKLPRQLAQKLSFSLRYHQSLISDCGFTSPLEGVGAIHINTLLVWQFVLVGIGLAFLAELRQFGFQPKS
jgi:hypothetical protein